MQSRNKSVDPARIAATLGFAGASIKTLAKTSALAARDEYRRLAAEYCVMRLPRGMRIA